LDSLKKITKDVLTTLRDNKLEITPENYFKEFKKHSEFSKIKIKELEEFNEIKNSLTEDEIRFSPNLESFNDIAKILSKRVPVEDLKELIIVLNDVLSPSIDFTKNQENEVFIKNLLLNPKTIVEKDTHRKLQCITRKRIDADRIVIREKTNDIIKITNLMEKYFEKSLIESSNSTKEVNKIKNELNELNISDSSFRELGMLQSKLISTIFNIENTLQKNYLILDHHKSNFEELNETIEKLRNELSAAKEEKSIDFLTNILNRRAYKEEVEKIEKKYAFFSSNYALMFIDIDHFKKINDTHGHACGDTILKTFASILKKLTRQEDIVCRYGGEEFVTLINYKNEDEIITYVNRLKRIIKTNNFIYNNERIHVSFSAGIAFRDKYKDYYETRTNADELVYQAKKEGRDKIIFDNGIKI